MARHRSKVVGTKVVGVVAFMAMVPTVSLTPPAQADVDDVMEALFAPFLTAAGAVDGDTLFSPVAWEAFLTPEHWDAALAVLTDPGPAPAVDFYTGLHDAAEQWIASPLGGQVDGFINHLFGSTIIGDGAAGTEANPDGGSGGWLFGDGGAGWSSTTDGAAGGSGGAAGIFGNGGEGGDGGAGAAGGDGGAGGWLMGNGGNGGEAGNGDTLSGLPALGGAGGNPGLWSGDHGAVGRFSALPGGITGTTAPPVEVSNGWLTNGDGQVVMLHGLNQVYKIPPYEPSADGFSADDAAFLAANGFNAVRLGIIWSGVEPEPGVIDYDYLASIQQTVQILGQHNIVAILDMHQDLYNEQFGGEGAPDWATDGGGLWNPDAGFPANYFLNPAENHAWDAFWGNAKAPDGVGLLNHYAQTWQAVAHYFKGDPNVGGYEIMNEPWPGTTWLGSLFGNPYFEGQQLTPFYNQVDAAIRSVDPNKTVFFEPTTLVGSLPMQTQLGSVEDPNSVYSFHNYCITTSLIPDASFGCDLNADIVLGFASAYAQEHNIPALMTEFGATNTIPTITAGINSANQHLIGWTEWAYSGNDITSASPDGQALVLDPSKPPIGDNVNFDKLDALAQPYPQLISGTPTSWSFSNGTFAFSYSTDHADGSGSFGAGAQTTISVPPGQYPNGYSVSVTGGHVTSMSGASVLTINSDAGASAVTVTVTPKP
ncbi:MAG: cellulase family glycosylhydrolase [Mycobacterium sp.]